MAKKLASFRVVVALAVLVLVSACLSKSSPTGPSNGNQPPDQTGLEALPTVQHRLVDAEGEELEIWVRLLFIKPDRRSVLTLNGPCPPHCFHFQTEVGHSFAEEKYGYGTFQIGLGKTKDTIDRMLISLERVGRVNGTSLTQTKLVPKYDDQAWILKEVPTYLVIKGVSEICATTIPCWSGMEVRDGSWNFPVEYK